MVSRTQSHMIVRTVTSMVLLAVFFPIKVADVHIINGLRVSI